MTNDANSILDSLLFYAANEWGMDEDQITENMNKIAFHESKGDPSAIQKSDKTKSGFGPGRGLFQFEIGQGQGANTAIQRLINQLGYSPDFVKGLGERDYDVSGLTPEQQKSLFLANLLQMKHKPDAKGRVKANFAGVDTDEELADYWAQYHQAGTTLGTDEYDTMINKFLRDLQDY